MSALAISEDVKFDCEKKQLAYDVTEDNGTYRHQEKVNRYAITRKDTGKLLGIHSDEYIVRPYYELAEKVNEVIEQTINLDKYEIETVDRIHEGGKKYTRLVNFWSEEINMDNFDIWNNVANLYLLQGDTVTALATYNYIVTRNPALTDVWLNLGVVYALSNQKEKARNAWERILAAEPNNASAQKFIRKLNNN